MGEIVHGDYRRWVNRDTLDSVTNYECYKGLYSSHVDKNYFEIAYSLNRQFGEGGIYADLPLYAFADNHDVNRVASSLNNPAHLYTLYALLLTMPGIPSIYYGSEWGIEGRKANGDDRPLRPHLALEQVSQSGQNRDLAGAIARFASIRHRSGALRYGNYRQLLVDHQLLAFSRQTQEECVIVAVNASDAPVLVDLHIPACGGRQLTDLLNQGEAFPISDGKARINHISPHWARIMLVE
jgi:glycosidase